MRIRSMLMLTSLAAATMLAMAVSAASARQLSTSEQEFEIIWNAAQGAGKTPLNLISSGATTRCNVTLLGRFDARTIRKLAIRVGSIRHGAISSVCTGGTEGTSHLLTETLPWSVNYVGFVGTLPDISTIQLTIIGLRVAIHPAGLTECLIESTVTEPFFGIMSLERGRTSSFRVDESARIRLRGGFICEIAGSAQFGGLALVRNLPNTADLTITLI